MQYVENHPFYRHGLIAVGQSTYRCYVLRQTANAHPKFDPSLHRRLKVSSKLFILYLYIEIVTDLDPKDTLFVCQNLPFGQNC
jgi:hypothetical protein